MSRLAFLSGDSFFHRMDPTWKFVWNFVVVITVIVNFDLIYSAAWYAYVAFLALVLSGISLRQYLRSLSFFVAIAVFICIWSIFYFPAGTQLLAAIGPIRVTFEGVLHGLSMGLRILVIVTLSIIFVLTTDPGRMVESMIQIGHVPYRIGYTAYATLRFIPLYENEARIISNAHMVRGMGETGKSLLSNLKVYWALLIPLLVSGIRRAQATSIAMDSRGFGAYDDRTVIRQAAVAPSTIVFVLAHVLLLVGAVIYFVLLGHGVASTY